MLASILLMLVAGVACTVWLRYVTESTRAANLDRQRTLAHYAAEAGVEQVVDFFNNPAGYTAANPDNYTTQANHPVRYALEHNSAKPASYRLFEPYILMYDKAANGQPLYVDGKLKVTLFTYFQNNAAGSPELISLTSKIPSCTLNLTGNSNIIMRDRATNTELARVTQIRLIHPTDLKAAGQLPVNRRVVTKVVATGRTPKGAEVTIETILTENPTLGISAPGAIISNASVDYNGNFNVHWGEAWAKTDVLLPANFDIKMPREYRNTDFNPNSNPPADKWFKLRTRGVIRDNQGLTYADGRAQSGFSLNKILASAGAVYYQPFHPNFLYSFQGNKSIYGGYDNLYQNQTLELPMYDYTDWKTFIQAYGFPYYYTYTDGLIYGTDSDPSSLTYGAVVGKSYDEWFDISPSDPDYAAVDKMVTFIDSIPVDDSGNVAPLVGGIPRIDSRYYPRDPNFDGRRGTIRISGGGTHSRGAMFMAADLDMTGQGNPPQWDDIPDSIGGVKMPGGLTPPNNLRFDVFHYGFLCAWGRVSGGGNRGIYGSIWAQNGYDSGGDPKVYYNYRLKDGSWLNLNSSRVFRGYWTVKR